MKVTLRQNRTQTVPGSHESLGSRIIVNLRIKAPRLSSDPLLLADQEAGLIAALCLEKAPEPSQLLGRGLALTSKVFGAGKYTFLVFPPKFELIG